ncbi:MAG: SDR family oxidoreductase [Actinobacteria bacterium]|nr:SDR family oxidoreductase [Actinomycetota bacterium]
MSVEIAGVPVGGEAEAVPGRHRGRVALVTGAARGIGRAYARRLARDGADVVLVDVLDTAEAAAEVRATGREAFEIGCDIGSPEEVEALAASVGAAAGRCDILVNNAALFTRSGILDTSLEEWRRLLAVNLDGLFLVTRALVPGMRERGWGRVVNVASTTLGLVMGGSLAYITSKGAVVGFTRALASEVGPWGITVNAVMPGLTRTEITEEEEAAGRLDFEAMVEQQPIRRGVVPADLADVVSFLASEEARLVTAQTLVVDGGIVRL